VAGFIEGSATVFFGVAERAALPMLVHPSQRSVAVGQNEARQNVAQLAGPALGGALFGLSWSAPFAADAVSYLASLVTLPFIKTRMQADAAASPRARRRLRAEMGEGLAWTWRQPFLRYSAFFAASVNILLQVLTLGLIVLAQHEGASSAQIGIIVGCMGAGGLAGAFAAPWSQRKIPAGVTITGCMWIWAVLLALVVERLGADVPDADHAERTAGPDQQRRPADRLGGHPARLAAGRVPAPGPVAVRRDGRGRRRDDGDGHRGHRARAGA